MALTVTRDVMRRISEIEAPRACALNEDLTDEFPDDVCAAHTLAVGFSVGHLCWVRSAMLPSGRTRTMASIAWCIGPATR